MQVMHHSDKPKLIDTAVDIIGQCGYISTIDPETLKLALTHGSTIILERNETLITEGDTEDKHVYILLEGELDVVKEDRFILKLSEPGQLIGEMSIINAEPRYASVICVRPSRVVAINASFITDTKNTNDSTGYACATFLSRVLAEKLRVTSDRAKLYEDALFESQQFEAHSQELERDINAKIKEIQLYTKAVENNQDAVAVCSKKGKIELCNKSFHLLFHSSPKSIKNKTIEDFFEGLLEENNTLFLQFPRQWTGERIALGQSGERFPAFISISPIAVNQGSNHATHFAVSVRDITTQKQYEENIIKTNVELQTTQQTLEDTVTELEKSNRIKSDFYENISHQLKSPLVSIHSFAEIILKQMDTLPNTDLKSFLSRIINEEKKLENMVENILTMTELSSEWRDLDLTIININEIFDELDNQKALKLISQPKEVTRKETLVGDKKKLVKACALFLEHINSKSGKAKTAIISHSYHIGNDAHQITFTTSEDYLKQTLQLNIDDNLPHSTDSELSLAIRIISAHKGQVAFNEDEQQCVIKILLPTEPEKGIIKPTRVMIIDENKTEVESYQRVIESLLNPISTTHFNSPIAAFEALSSLNPDIILVDPVFTTGYMTPTEFIKALLNANNNQSEIIVVSSCVNDRSELTELLSHPIKDYVAKPFSQIEAQFRFKNILTARQQVSILFNNIKRAQQSAITDQLTQVFNRRYFDTFIQEQLIKSELQGTKCSLILVDIDHFKQYNDLHGHLVGDEGLKLTGKILKSAIRASDMVARYGGEEFVVVLPGTNKTIARHLAEKIRELISATLYPQGETQPLGHISASLGVSTYPEDGKDAETLLEKADECLYIAKERGRNCVVEAK